MDNVRLGLTVAQQLDVEDIEDRAGCVFDDLTVDDLVARIIAAELLDGWRVVDDRVVGEEGVLAERHIGVGAADQLPDRIVDGPGRLIVGWSDDVDALPLASTVACRSTLVAA